MSQCARLEAYMNQRGSVTPIEAWRLLGIYRLSARINDLRKRGVLITTEPTEVENQFGEKCTVARYRMESPQAELFA